MRFPVGFDQVLSPCGQLDQLFIFCTHHSRKLDLNIVTEYEVLAFKFPNKMHTKLERRETAANLLENTQWRYAYEVERFGECVEGRLLNALSPKDILDWNAELQYAHSPMGTAGQNHAELRAFFNYLEQLGEDADAGSLL